MTRAEPRRSTAARSGAALAAALFVAGTLALAPGDARAADPADPADRTDPAAAAPIDWGYDLADALMSPYCPGRALSECPSPQADDLRRWILDQERAGRSRAEVEAQLYAEWGDSLRQAPRASGVGLVAYAIPILVIGLGALLVVVFLRRQASPAETPPAPAPRLAPVDAALERELDEELRQGEDAW